MSAGTGGRSLRAGTEAPAGGPSDHRRPELTEAALRAWGRRLGAEAVRARMFVALHGPLGAGKTTLVRAAFEGGGAVEPAVSPTFTLVHEHRAGELTLYHVDLYRIESPEQLDELGWEELVAADAPVFVEWAERAGGRLPPDRWVVRLASGSEAGTRRVEVERRGRAPDPPPVDAAAEAEANGERP